MKVGSGRNIMSAASITVVLLLGTASLSGQTGTAQKPLMAEDAFKNVQVLRGIPASEFMETMGFFAVSLTANCTTCHGEDSGWQLGKVCGRHSAEADHAQDGCDGEHHQPNKLWGEARGDLLHLPSG